MAPRFAVEQEARLRQRDAIRRDLGRADLVRHVRHDLEADPETAVARQLEAEATEVEDLLDVAGKQRRKEGIVERDFGMRRQRRGLRQRVITAERQHAPVPADTGEIRMLEDVARAVDARAFAVPDTEHAIVLRLREIVRELAAVDDRRAEVFVDAGDELHVMLGEQRRVALEREIEPSERRPAIAGDQRRRVQAAPLVRAMLVERQPDEGLDAGEENEALFLAVLGVEREIERRCHHCPL
jgi:hypothetical protein